MTIGWARGVHYHRVINDNHGQFRINGAFHAKFIKELSVASSLRDWKTTFHGRDGRAWRDPCWWGEWQVVDHVLRCCCESSCWMIFGVTINCADENIQPLRVEIPMFASTSYFFICCLSYMNSSQHFSISIFFFPWLVTTHGRGHEVRRTEILWATPKTLQRTAIKKAVSMFTEAVGPKPLVVDD